MPRTLGELNPADGNQCYAHCILTSQKLTTKILMKEKGWFKPKAFTHLTPKLGFEDERWIQDYISNNENIEKHRFYPLIHRTIVTKRLKEGKAKDGSVIKKHYTYKDGKRESTAKYREIYYPNHLDSHIYSYYAQEVLEPLFELELKAQKELNESILAYRRIPVNDNSRCKCNIDFANETFEEIKNTKGEVAVLALDVSKFFDSLDHKILKQTWTRLLGRRDLPADHYNIFKSITSFSFVELKSLLKEFGYKHPNQLIQKEVSSFINSGEIFRQRIKANGYLKTNPFRRNEDGNKIRIGIPQGTPISAFLANLYLLDFDKEVIKLAKKSGTIYRRYSDDILIICPASDYKHIEEAIYRLIDKYKLIIQKSKTQRSFFLDGKLLKGEAPLNYLGFQFDGTNKVIKSSSLSKFYRKMKRGVKYRARRAKIARKKVGRGFNVDTSLHRKKLYQQYSFLGGKKGSKKKRSFFSYAYFAAKVMNSSQIKSQLSRAWVILNEEIKRYESKFRLK